MADPLDVAFDKLIADADALAAEARAVKALHAATCENHPTEPPIDPPPIIPPPVVDTTWPDPQAHWIISPYKTAGMEMTDTGWLHLHAGMMDAESVSLAVTITHAVYQILDPAAAGIQVRYSVRGVPVSAWLDAPFTFTLAIDNPLLPALDGIHAVSLDVQGPTRATFRPQPLFLHLARGRAVEPTVPMMSRDNQAELECGPGVVSVTVPPDGPGYPLDSTVVPWVLEPAAAGLWLEPMQPTTHLFECLQMKWQEPQGTPSAGLKFIRAIPAETTGSDVRGAYWNGLDPNATGYGGTRNLPFKDGPRGVGWTHGFIQGQCDASGGMAFVSVGGPLRYMRPNGELITVAGWRVKPGLEPVWYVKSYTSIRQNMELRGTWVHGQSLSDPGFHLPMDVTIDPLDPLVWYVAGGDDHCIWKVIVDPVTFVGTVSVFAGDLAHQPGESDGLGMAARFNRPTSIVFDPIHDVLYVADHENHRICQITRKGVVSTVLTRATTFPFCVRVDSFGRLLVLEQGTKSIRRFNLTTNDSTLLVNVPIELDRGWGWFDVNRSGNAGPLNSIYWATYTGANIDGDVGQHYNEVYGWSPAEGGGSKWIFGDPHANKPKGLGPASYVQPPHYGWLVAVDPRGAVYLAGGGAHNIARLRVARPTDPSVEPTEYYAGMWIYNSGELWRYGTLDRASFTFPHGWEGHNMIGFPDSWGTHGMTDAQLIAAFGIPPSITGDVLRDLLKYIRFHSGAV